MVITERPLSPDHGAESEGDLESIAEALRDEVRKLGRSQLRVDAVAKSERGEILRLLEQILATSRQPRKDEFRDLLEAVDGLEAAMLHTRELQIDPDIMDAWQSGIQMVHDRLLTALKNWEITPISAVGQRFEPRYHQAVGVCHTDDVPEGTITEEQRRGYLYQDDVLRYSEVIVARTQEN